MPSFTDAQKADLRDMLAHPLLQLALQNALSDVLVAYSGASTMETAALCYKAEEGARMVVSALYANADSKKVPVSTHRRFKTETPIES